MRGSEKGFRVMIMICRTAETLLKKASCQVVAATDGFDALAKNGCIRARHYLCQYHDAHLDGDQTCALIKNNSAFRKIPVIMLSVRMDSLIVPEDVAGSNYYLANPFSRDELFEAIRDHS